MATEKIDHLKYTILRRAICYGKQGIERLKSLCYSLEGKDIKQLTEIHKQWIGY